MNYFEAKFEMLRNTRYIECMISQRQLAAYLKLSPGTVSRALRNLPGTDVQTQAAVMEAAAKLGYRMPARISDQQTRGNGETQSRLIGVLISNGERNSASNAPSMIFTRALQGAAEAARELNVSLQVDCVSGDLRDQIHLPAYQSPALREGLVKGLILMGLFSSQTVEELAKQQPCVRLHDRRVKMDCIAQDDLQASNDLIDYLVQLKHRNIGFMAPASDIQFTFGHARLAGYLESMLVHQLSMKPEWWLGVGESANDNHDALLARAETLTRQGVTAWVCVNDVWGYDLLSHFQKSGIRVPEDVSIVSFDATSAPSGMKRLTSIDWPFEDMGAASVRRLIRRMQNPLMAAGQTIYSGKIIPGETTGPATTRTHSSNS